MLLTKAKSGDKGGLTKGLCASIRLDESLIESVLVNEFVGLCIFPICRMKYFAKFKSQELASRYPHLGNQFEIHHPDKMRYLVELIDGSTLAKSIVDVISDKEAMFAKLYERLKD